LRRSIKIKTKSTVQIPISLQLIGINKDLGDSANVMLLLELDGISEMLVNYVENAEEKSLRFEFIGTLLMFVSRYKYFANMENLNIIKMILLNELYKKNLHDPVVIKLINSEMRFNEKQAAAFKSVIEKELREVCMREFEISGVSDPRYKSIVKPMIKDFEDFYYSFR